MAVVELKVDGIDRTSAVIFADAEFTSAVNGRAGTCHFRVKDANQTQFFTVGKEITLDVDGVRSWGGYAMQIKRGYWFDSYDCRCKVNLTPRYWEVEGADYNILFERRVLYDKSEPANGRLTSFPAGTADNTVINYYIANHLDLSGDGLGTSLVTSVGTPSTDTEIQASAGWTWSTFMRWITSVTGAIYYIRPDKEVVHTDVETADAPFGISDDPTGGEIGCRDLEIDYDGSNLVNDALVWGAGQGSSSPVFSRATDTTSITAHGRWQLGVPFQSIWKQATADQVSNSYVYGSPQSLRGGKDDKRSAQCAVYTAGLVCGQKVTLRSAVFGFTETIPIRMMKITFPTKEDVKWDLTLSHEIDQPWTGFDAFPFPPFPPFPAFDISIPGFPSFDPCFVGCTYEDTFSRTVAAGWGTADSGQVWTGDSSGGDPEAGLSVNGARGRIDDLYSLSGFALGVQTGLGGVAIGSAWSLTASIEFSIVDSSTPYLAIGYGAFSEILLAASTTAGNFIIAAGDTQMPFGFAAGTKYNFHYQKDSSGTVYLNCWDATTEEPSVWMLTGTTVMGPTTDLFVTYQPSSDRYPTVGSVYVDDLCIVVGDGLDSCTETFSRTESIGWGISEFGPPWVISNSPDTFERYSVDGSIAKVKSQDDSILPLDLHIPTVHFTGLVLPFEVRSHFKWDDLGLFSTTTGKVLLHSLALVEIPYSTSRTAQQLATVSCLGEHFPSGTMKLWLRIRKGATLSDTLIATFAVGTRNMEYHWLALRVANSLLVQGMLWKDGDAEPVWTDLTPAVAISPSEFLEVSGHNSNVNNLDTYIDRIEVIEGCTTTLIDPCADPLTAPPPDAPVGAICENLTRIPTPSGVDPSLTYFKTSNVYKAGTTKVWVDGLRLAWYDYDEHPDEALIVTHLEVNTGGGDWFDPPKGVYGCYLGG